MPGSGRAVLLTPRGRGAVATIRVEGAEAVSAAESHLRPAAGTPLGQLPVGRIVLCRWEDTAGAPEEVVVCRAGNEALEIHCHGGAAPAERILEGFAAAGIALQDWREWARASETDAIAFEARLALAEARTERAARILLEQYQGALRLAVEQAMADCKQGLDASASEKIACLLQLAPVGEHLATPWRVTIAGAPNVGKSSLANALLGFERSIVYAEPGTTRDVVTAQTAIDGWPVEIADTAGLRDAADEIERQGVAWGEKQTAAADLVLLVFDQSQCWTPASEALLRSRPAALVVHNKADLAEKSSRDRPPGLHTSAKTGRGIAELLAAIGLRLVPKPPLPGAAAPFTARQRASLHTAREHLSRGDCQAAQEVLARIVTGEPT